MNNGDRVVADEFGRAIAKVAVAQICQRIGFDSFNDSVLEAFADIAIRYVQNLGKTANFYANLANRTECNLFDIIQSLEDLSSSVGFPGGSESCSSLIKSGTLIELMEYIKLFDEIPFSQPVYQFPVVKERKLTPSFVQMGETVEGRHVPEWLPAFPDPHTYIHSAVWNERNSDPRSDKVELARQRRKAESSLLTLQKRLLSTGSNVANVASKTKKSRVFDSESEKPVPVSNVENINNHVSILETFAPVMEALSGRVSESGENGEREFSDKRPAVRLHFNNGRKMIGDSLDLRLWNRGTGRISSWFARDEVMDEKKRRAEYILRQSIEKRLDLPFL